MPDQPTRYCMKCHTSLGSAEKGVDLGGGTMHEHCYRKHLRELEARAKERRAVIRESHGHRRWLC